MRIAIITWAAMTLAACPTVAAGAATPDPVFSGKPGYAFITADIGLDRITKYDGDGVATWTYGKVKPIDVWALADGTVLTAYLPSPLTGGKGGVRLVGADQQTLYDHPFDDEIMSVQPLADGHVLIAECHEGRVTELDRQGQRLASFLITSPPNGHKTMRQLRLTKRGTIIVGECYSHQLREYDRSGALLRQCALEYCYCPQPLPDEHTLVACWNAPKAQVVELDATNTIVWRLTPAELPQQMGVSHIAEAIRLPSGNTLVSASCKAAGGNAPRTMLFEVTPDKAVVWRMTDTTSATWMTAVKQIPSWTPALPGVGQAPGCAAAPRHAVTADAMRPLENLALTAQVSATAEYGPGWEASGAVDGIVPQAKTGDRGQAWAVKGATHAGGADFQLAWPSPQTIACAVYYGRVAEPGDCWTSCTLLADGAPVPATAFPLKDAPGPQVLLLPQAITARSLTLRFTGSHGGPNPGAAEIQVFSASPSADDLIGGALWEQAQVKDLTTEQLQQAAQMLDHADPFVAALGEWAIAIQVGHDNDHGVAVWPSADNPEWYRRWASVPAQHSATYDWIRHGFLNGVLANPLTVRRDIERLVARGLATATLATGDRQREAQAQAAALSAVGAKAQNGPGTLPALRILWLEAHGAVRALALLRPELDFSRLLFNTRFGPHHKCNVCGVHYNWVYKPGGDICMLEDLRQPGGAVTPLLRGALGPGHVDGLDLWFDGDKVVFGWASQKEWPPKDVQGKPYFLSHIQNNYAFELMKITEPLHLYEAKLDGSGVRQLTNHGYWSDLEPTYLPDGGVAFASDRSGHAPSCDGWENDITDLNLYRLSADHGTIRRLTNQKDIDMHPHLLDNGLIGYLRWEYAERDFWDIHALWVVRPDGTQADALFKQHMPLPKSVREARSIPNSTRYVAIAAGHHCYPVGPLIRIDSAKGMNQAEAIDIIAMGSPPQEGAMAGTMVDGGGVRDAKGLYLTPYALSDTCFLTSFAFSSRLRRPVNHGREDVGSNDAAIYLVDTLGNKELLYRDRLLCAVCPLPLRARPKPPVLPDTADYTKDHATCVMANVYEGMADVAPGSIKHLRILEALPWPVTRDEGSRYLGGKSFAWQVAQESNWNPVRVIGIVPVEQDGSAHFTVPALTNASVYFEVLDAHYCALQRMRTGICFQPGETRSCNGCHETRSSAPTTVQGMAAKRPPDQPTPPSWGAATPLSFETLVQPVLDRHCVSCHGGEKPAAGLSLAILPKVAFGRDQMYASYFNIRNRHLVACTTQRLDGSITKPLQFGSPQSKLIQHLLKEDEHRKLPLTADEWLRLVTWVDANCPYYGALYNKRPEGGGTPRREAYPWHDPWAPSAEIPAMQR